jgi:lysophospholipase L1-like esterase
MDRRSFFQSFGLVGLAAATTYLLSRPKVRRPKGIYVQMGTSVTAGLHAPGANLTPVVVGERLNLFAINVGFDGACAGPFQRPDLDNFSLYKLVDAIISGNWAAQEVSMPFLGNGNEPALARIKTVDFNQITHLGLEYGTNDFTLCAPIAAFRESLSYSVRKLLAAFPKARLFLITPAWRLNFEELDADTHANEKGILLKEYVDAMISTAAAAGVPCLDMSSKLGINIKNYKFFAPDGVHPNETGARVRGEVIASFIQSAF